MSYRDDRHREAPEGVWRAILFIVLIIVAICALCLGGCATVIPEPVTSSQPSFDGNELNSGIIAAAPGGFLVTPHFRDRYNLLVAEWGPVFTPALVRDAGLTPSGDAWLIDREHLVKFLRMNSWHKSGRPPP